MLNGTSDRHVGEIETLNSAKGLYVKMIDTHIHSNYSSDSDMLPEVACENAISTGLDGLIFTDHLDIDYPGFEQFGLIDFKNYSEYIDRLKDQYKTKLLVLKGIEVGIQPHVIEDSLKKIKSVNFDYVLASVHVIDGIDPYYSDFYSGKSMYEAYELYLQKILYAIVNFTDYDSIGHFEYITRYARYDDRTLRYNNHTDVFEAILKEIIARGKGFEINTGSFRDKPGISTAEYDITILKRYRELGGDLICLGSDAHNTDYIGYKFSYFRNIMLEAGFANVVHYENRKPVYTKIY